jgi:hypothetical protein
VLEMKKETYKTVLSVMAQEHERQDKMVERLKKDLVNYADKLAETGEEKYKYQQALFKVRDLLNSQVAIDLTEIRVVVKNALK